MQEVINLEVEQGVIGSVLANNNAMRILPKDLNPEHFSSEVHQRIWQAIKENINDGVAVDAATLKHKFENSPHLQQAGGGDYLKDIARASVAVINLQSYAEVLINLAGRRKIISIADNLRTMALTDFSDDTLSAEVASGGIEQLRGVVDRTTARTMFHGNDLLELIVEDYKLQRKPISTGLKRLDLAMGGGIHAGFMYGIGGRKKMGKTMLVATIAAHLAQQKVKHLIVCAEMHPKEVYMRILGGLVQCSTEDFRNGRALSDKNLRARIVEASERISEYCLFVAEPGIAFNKLREVIAGAQATKGIQGYILDYWQLVGGKEYGKNQVEHLDGVAQWIADYGRRNNLWSIVMSQLNQDDNTRGGEGLRLACDQLYFLKACGEGTGDETLPARWLHMAESRYTKWLDVGSSEYPSLELVDGTHFMELGKNVSIENYLHLHDSA